MNRAAFGALFSSVLEHAVDAVEAQLGEEIPRRYEIELHGAHHAGTLMPVERALNALYVSDEVFYRVIDLSVKSCDPETTRIFMRVSGHEIQSFEEPRFCFDRLACSTPCSDGKSKN